MKNKETLEEFAERLREEINYGASQSDIIDNLAKWQQEPEQFFNDDRVKTLEKAIEYLLKKQAQDKNKYSEEDMKQAYLDGCKIQLTNTYHVKKWFEKFKKK